MKPDDKRQIKSATRLYLVQALFQMEASGVDADAVQNEFMNFRFGAREDGIEWAAGNAKQFETLLNGAVRNQAKIDQLIDQALVEKWPIARIDPTLRAIFRGAGAELLAGKTPPRVVISEFVDVAKAFYSTKYDSKPGNDESDSAVPVHAGSARDLAGTVLSGGREPKFVNAVLDYMARALQPDKFQTRRIH